MATVTVDQHCLQLDGQRLWIVAGTVSCAGTPSELWHDRLVAARRAGLNTIVVPAAWADYEHISGKFDFKGERSIATFIRLAGDIGLHVIVRVGPHVDDALDLGGLPPSLFATLDPAEPLRAPGPEFMARCSAWITALAKQIAPLQATRTRSASAGPIIAVQLEHRWLCGDPELAAPYLNGLSRFLRERGIDVPVINTNNLFATAEGQIECWSGDEDLHAITRQLGEVLEKQPRIVADLGGNHAPIWGEEDSIAPASPHTRLHAIASVLAGGGQFNLSSFSRGMRFGFSGGRADTAIDRFIAPGNAADILDESGASGDSLHAVRRICTFASSFARLFASLEADFEPVVVTPALHASASQPKSKRTGAPPSIIHRRGAQGSVVFLFGERSSAITLTLADGSQTIVPMMPSGVTWLLQDAHLFARTTLDLCTLPVFAYFGTVLVCFAPQKTQGEIIINGAVISITAPTGRTPHIETLEGVTIVVCNEDQIDDSVLLADRFIVGTRDVDAGDQPVAPKALACTTVHQDGTVDSSKAAVVTSPASRAPTIRTIERAAASTYAEGASDRFVRIDGPTPLAKLGVPSGYAWLRAEVTSKTAHKAKVALFDAADRAHLFVDGAPAAVLGVAPGATGCLATLSLRKGKQHIVALVDNLGRSTTEGFARSGKGLGHIEEVKPLKASAPKVELRTPVDLLKRSRPLMNVHTGDVTDPHRLVWAFSHRRKSPLVLMIDQPPALGAVLVNDAFVALIEPALPARIRLTSDILKQGNNTVEVALLAPPDAIDDALAAVRAQAALYEVVDNLTASVAWANAAWAAPNDRDFAELTKAAAASASTGIPTWWRMTFDTPTGDAPLFFEPIGLSKGQLFLNGRNLCRYFVATAAGKSVPGQDRYWLPAPWLLADERNELLIFDEHGNSPAKAKIRVFEGNKVWKWQ